MRSPIATIFAISAAILVAYNLFMRPDGIVFEPPTGEESDEPAQETAIRQEPVTMKSLVAAVEPAAAEPVAPAAAAQAPSADASAADGMSFEDVSTVRARLTGVPASKAHGTLSSQCKLTVDGERRGLLRYLPALPLTSLGAGECASLPPALCVAVRGALGGVTEAPHRPRLVVTSFVGAQLELLRVFADNAAALALPMVALAMDAEGAAAARGVCFSAPAPAGGSTLERKWRGLAQLVEAGVDVLYVDVDGVLASEPFAALHFDSDVEALSEAWEEDDARGWVMGCEGPSSRPRAHFASLGPSAQPRVPLASSAISHRAHEHTRQLSRASPPP